MILEIKWFCKLIGVRGIVLWPFIVVNNKKDKVLVLHEKIHMAQAKELWVFGFYWLYFKYYFQNRRKFNGDYRLKHLWSYLNIPFEQEAYAFQSQLDYLQHRTAKAWKKYI